MTEIETFNVALERFCGALSQRVVLCDDNADVDALLFVGEAIRRAIGSLLEVELEVEVALGRHR